MTLNRKAIEANPEYKALKRAVDSAMDESARGNYEPLYKATHDLNQWLDAKRKADSRIGLSSFRIEKLYNDPKVSRSYFCTNQILTAADALDFVAKNQNCRIYGGAQMAKYAKKEVAEGRGGAGLSWITE